MMNIDEIDVEIFLDTHKWSTRSATKKAYERAVRAMRNLKLDNRHTY